MTLYREKWETVKALFEAAQDIDCAHRVNFLEGATSDPGVRAEVERLLREYESAGDFLSKDSPLASVVSSFNLASSSSEFEDGVQIELLPGTILSDRFEIVELIGRGGMGEVWLARQSIPVRRLVALKVINAGRFDEFLVD